MKKLIFIVSLTLSLISFGQGSSKDYFNNGANQYIEGNKQMALNTVNEGLRRFPSDEKLRKLRQEIAEEEEEEEKQDEQNEDKKDQDKQNGDEKSEEKQDQEKQDSEQKEGEESEEKKEQEQEGEQKEDESEQPNQEPSTREKLEEMNISEEKAKMILEALKNNEIQYIQQQKRKATQPRDSGKPDW